MIVLDTTVLVYAVGADHPHRDPSRALLQAVGDGAIDATTTVEVIQEFAHVRARRRGREDAAAHALDAADLLSPLLSIDEAILREGLSLWRSSASLGAFDCVLAAATLTLAGPTLVSADRAFSTVRGLAHVVPTSRAIEALVAEN